MEWFVFALVAAVFFGSRQVISKKVLISEHATEFLSVTCSLTFLFSLFFLPMMDFSYPLKIWGLMYLKALFVTIGWLLGSKALRHLEISYVTPLTNLSPIFLIVWSVIFLGEMPSLLQYAGVAFLIFGAYWLQANHHMKNMLHPLKIFKNKYAAFMLFAIFVYSWCSVLDKVILRTVDPYTFLSFTFLVLAIHYLLIQFVKYNGLKDIKHAFVKGKHLMFVIALLLLFSDIFYYTAVALPGAMVSLIIPLKRTSTLIATLVGGRLFHEHDMIYRFIACGIMIVGVVLIVIG
ncbi:MAG: EamA family transporter [Candidatus Woesearchaeota archaeon]